MKKQLSIFCICVFLAACKSATAPEVPNLIPMAMNDTLKLSATTNRVLYILNEGNFGKANSSLDAVVFGQDTVVHHLLTGLGGGNDILFDQGEILFVDNGSNMLDFFNASGASTDYESPFGLTAPNQMAIIAPNFLPLSHADLRIVQ